MDDVLVERLKHRYQTDAEFHQKVDRAVLTISSLAPNNDIPKETLAFTRLAVAFALDIEENDGG